MKTIFTLSGCLTYTFVIVTSIILIVRIVRAFKGGDYRVSKKMLFYELISLLLIGTSLAAMFQSYAKTLA